MRPLLLVLLAFASAAQAQTLVVVNKGDNDVSLVDIASGVTRTRIPAGEGPHEVATSPDGRWAVVTNYGRSQGGNTLNVIDVANGSLIDTHSTGEHTWPHGIVWAGDRVWVTAENEGESGALLGVDPVDGTTLAAIPTAQAQSHMVALHPDGVRAYVTNIASGSVTAIDLVQQQRLASVVTGRGAEGLAVSPDGRELWVANQADNDIVVLDADTLAPLARVRAPSLPIRVAFTPDGSRVLVTCARTEQISVFDAQSREMIAHVHFPRDKIVPQWAYGYAQNIVGLLIAPDGKHAYAALLPSREIAEINLDDYSIERYLPVGRQPDGMAWSPLTVTAP
jgi:YVTN family beta-propeller protein